MPDSELDPLLDEISAIDESEMNTFQSSDNLMDGPVKSDRVPFCQFQYQYQYQYLCTPYQYRHDAAERRSRIVQVHTDPETIWTAEEKPAFNSHDDRASWCEWKTRQGFEISEPSQWEVGREYERHPIVAKCRSKTVLHRWKLVSKPHAIWLSSSSQDHVFAMHRYRLRCGYSTSPPPSLRSFLRSPTLGSGRERSGARNVLRPKLEA